MKSPRYRLDVYNGRFKIYVDGVVMLAFNQIDFRAYYAFKDDHSLYGIDVYLTNSIVVETSYKTKAVWLGVLQLLSQI